MKLFKHYSLALLLAIPVFLACHSQAAADDYGNTPGTAHSVGATPAAISGSIELETDVDVFVFNLASSALIRVELTPDQAATVEMEAFYVGEASDGLTALADGNSGTVALERYLDPGMHYLAVSADTGTATYNLSISNADLASRAAALDLGTPATQVGTTAMDGGYDVYSVDANATGLFSATVDANPGVGAVSIDAATAVLRDGPAMLASNDDGPTPPDSALASPMFSGLHWLLVRDVYRRSGDYLLDYAFAAPTALTVGGMAAGVLAGPGDVELYAFTLALETVVSLWTTGSMDTVLWLADGTGAIVGSNDDSGPGFNSFLTATLPAGDYAVAVKSADGIAGSFTMAAAEGMQPVMTTTGSTNLTLAAPGAASYVVQVPRDGRYRFHGRGAGMQLMATLYDANGNLVGVIPNSGNGFNGLFTLMQGTLTVVVESLNQSTGTIATSFLKTTAIAPVTKMLLAP